MKNALSMLDELLESDRDDVWLVVMPLFAVASAASTLLEEVERLIDDALSAAKTRVSILDDESDRF